MAITDYVEIVTSWDDEGNPVGGFTIPKEYVDVIKASSEKAQAIRGHSHIIPKEYEDLIRALINEVPEED